MELSKRVILASGSPRRKELLEMMGLDFEIISGNQDEKYTSIQPKEIVKELALMKAEYVAKKVVEEFKDDFLVIGADTIVVLDNQIIEKPGDEAEAFGMLAKLKNRSHDVYTGVALLDYSFEQCKAKNKQKTEKSRKEKPGEEKEVKEELKEECQGISFKRKVINFATQTKVHIGDISDDEIKAYINTGEPFDKAGGYGIQGRFAVFVKGIEGEYYNVMGLPVSALYKKLNELI